MVRAARHIEKGPRRKITYPVTDPLGKPFLKLPHTGVQVRLHKCELAAIVLLGHPISYAAPTGTTDRRPPTR